MPNWITNAVTIQGGVSALKFQKDKKTLDFEWVVPPPKNLFRGNLGEKQKKECKEKGVPNWYDWNIENWGTKWNATDGKIESKGKGKVNITFLTAWSPPIEIFEKLESMGFTVSGYWTDEGDDTVHKIGKEVSDFEPTIVFECFE